MTMDTANVKDGLNDVGPAPAPMALASIDKILVGIGKLPAAVVKTKFENILDTMRTDVRNADPADRPEYVTLFREMKSRSANTGTMRQALKELIVGRAMNIKLGFAAEKDRLNNDEQR